MPLTPDLAARVSEFTPGTASWVPSGDVKLVWNRTFRPNRALRRLLFGIASALAIFAFFHCSRACSSHRPALGARFSLTAAGMPLGRRPRRLEGAGEAERALRKSWRRRKKKQRGLNQKQRPRQSVRSRRRQRGRRQQRARQQQRGKRLWLPLKRGRLLRGWRINLLLRPAKRRQCPRCRFLLFQTLSLREQLR
jgi:hypothetical protein